MYSDVVFLKMTTAVSLWSAWLLSTSCSWTIFSWWCTLGWSTPSLSWLDVLDSTGCPKKNYHFTFCLIFQEPNNKITNSFFLLKTEIHTHILNTKPFLYDSRGLRCLRYKMGFLTHKFINKMTHDGPDSLKVTSSCPDQPLTDTDWPWQSPSDPMKH